MTQISTLQQRGCKMQVIALSMNKTMDARTQVLILRGTKDRLHIPEF